MGDEVPWRRDYSTVPPNYASIALPVGSSLPAVLYQVLNNSSTVFFILIVTQGHTFTKIRF